MKLIFRGYPEHHITIDPTDIFRDPKNSEEIFIPCKGARYITNYNIFNKYTDEYKLYIKLGYIFMMPIDNSIVTLKLPTSNTYIRELFLNKPYLPNQDIITLTLNKNKASVKLPLHNYFKLDKYILENDIVYDEFFESTIVWLNEELGLFYKSQYEINSIMNYLTKLDEWKFNNFQIYLMSGLLNGLLTGLSIIGKKYNSCYFDICKLRYLDTLFNNVSYKNIKDYICQMFSDTSSVNIIKKPFAKYILQNIGIYDQNKINKLKTVVSLYEYPPISEIIIDY